MDEMAPVESILPNYSPPSLSDDQSR